MTCKPYRAWLIALALSTFVQLPLLAQNWQGNDDWARGNDTDRSGEHIRASISGGGGSGKCTFEVVVNGVAEVWIRGGQGRLVSIDGSPASWRRLNCNQALPSSPNDFHFSGVDGHGRQSLMVSPSGNDGVAIIRIDNTVGSKRGTAEGYTGDITWKGDTYGSATGWTNGSGNWNNSSNNWSSGTMASAASQACMNAVATRIQQEHQNVTNLRPLSDTTTATQQSDGRTAVQGKGQYQAENGSFGKFSYRCLYDESNQQVLESSYSRE